MKSVLLITAIIGMSLAQYFGPPQARGYRPDPAPSTYGPAQDPPTYGPVPVRSPPGYQNPSQQGYEQPTYGPAPVPMPQNYPGSAPVHAPAPGPVPYRTAVTPYRAPQRNRQGVSDQISEGLQYVAERLEVIETRDGAQTNRVNELAGSARDNFDLANNFDAYLYNEITREQEQQDYRLHALEARLNEIRELRDRVNQLNEAAETLRDTVENKEREEIKYFQYEVNDLQNADIALQVRISEIQARADAINAQIDEVFETAASQEVSLGILEINVRRTIDSANRQVEAHASVRISPNGFDDLRPDATVTFPVAANSIPQGIISAIVGFRFRRGHSYDMDYPSIHFMNRQDPSYDSVVLSSMDTSTGGWTVDVLELDFDTVYYDNTRYTKSFLDGV